ncbi:trmY [Symbiodinium natans]|uniref:TrmY protein n=1 Tax=Symbiodinium natans TaxID=878477 RepID=A0A812P2G4_9DINO|nr:trmY [Symbiodinium natans]
MLAAEVCGPGCMPRAFLLLAKTSGCMEVKLNNLTEGRFDLICRVISAALFTSHGVRRNSSIFVHLGGSLPHRTLAVHGPEVKHWRPDERGGACLLQRLFQAGGRPRGGEESGSKEEKCLRGMSLTDESLYSAVAAALKYLQVTDARPCILILHPDGLPMHEVVDAQTAPLLVLGDDAGMEEDALGEVQRAALHCNVPVHCVSLGPVLLLGSHACVLAHYFMDVLHSCPASGQKVAEAHHSISESRKVQHLQ